MSTASEYPARSAPVRSRTTIASGVPFDAVPHECVADAYWALVTPLSAGDHTIRFAGGSASSGFSLDVTYEIIVRGR